MLFGKIVILHCENHMKHTNTLFEEMQSSVFKVDSTYDNCHVLKRLVIFVDQGYPSAVDSHLLFKNAMFFSYFSCLL